MKLPFLWITASFGAGIALARASDTLQPLAWLALAAITLAAAIVLLRASRLSAAWAAGLACWFCIGGLAAVLEPRALPENHVTRLAAAGELPDDIALRWRGRLTSDPVRLPWGTRIEIALEEVEIAGCPRAVSGGLRLSYFRNLGASAAEPEPMLRAGDRVEALVRARRPRNFLNPGAFDARAHLAREDIHLTGSLRSTELLHKLESPPPALRHRLARLRGAMLARIDTMFAAHPEQAAVLRAMLLGDRNFIDHDLAQQFQRTTVYHVLVVSGLHVAALAAFLFWLGRALRLPRWLVVTVTIAVLVAFVAVVEDQPPILRAALMAGVTLLATLMFRRVELLNTIALAAWILLLARPSALADPSFQLSFLAASMIGALALPWIALTSAPYRHALAHLTDPARDPAQSPRVAQFRLDVRDAAAWLAARLPLPAERASRATRAAVTGVCVTAIRLWDVLLVSAAIQLGMLPVMALYFHRVSLGSVPANIPASLLSAAIVPVGFLAMGLSAVWAALGNFAAGTTSGLLTMLLASVEWFDRAQWAAWRVPDPPLWLLAVYAGTLVLISIGARTAADAQSPPRTKPRLWVALAALAHAAMVLLVAVHPFPAQLARGQLEITALDVGQGDSIFAAFPDGRTLLVDGGGLFGTTRAGGFRTGLDIGEQVVSPYLWRRGMRRLDVVALTHAHQDHLDGLHAVLANFRVGELWVTRDVDSPAYRALLETAARRGVTVIHRQRGNSFSWGDVSGLVLWPDPSEGLGQPARNNDSLVLRLDFGRTSALLAGDIEQDVEAELVLRGDPLDVDFLKVPHHGSRTSTTTSFVAGVTPQAAAISLSPTNPFGHPHSDVMVRLQGAGARVLRTDRDGAVTFYSSGASWRVVAYAERPH